MGIEPTQIILLMAAAMITALATRRLALPYTVGLVAVGVGLAVSHVALHVQLTRDFIFDIILPPLLFEAALNLHWRELRRSFGLVLTLSIIGTVIAAGFVAVAMHFALGWPLASALVFGALIAATDPVSVIALFKDLGLHGRVRTLVESESLFNDVAASVVFALALAFALSPGRAPGPEIGWDLLRIVAGGAATGAVCGWVALILIGRTSDHLIEAALTMLAGYGAFFGAEAFGGSGILAAVISGLLLRNVGFAATAERNPIALSDRGRDFIHSLWEFIAFLSNSAIFPLIGLSVGRISLGPGALAPIAITIAIVLVGRALTVYPLSALFHWAKEPPTLREQHVLWWGGLRGALGLALALSLPSRLPLHDEIVIMTFVVAVFSIVVQGVSMPWLIRALGLAAPAKEAPPNP